MVCRREREGKERRRGSERKEKADSAEAAIRLQGFNKRAGECGGRGST
jgi:hypothetical protein